MRITKAIIPAAGRGTRMEPFSKLVPKELVPVGTRPVLLWVLEEARKAGIEEVGLVVRPGKELLERFLETLSELEPIRDLRVELIVQEEPRGLAEALYLGREFTGDEAFAVLLPDNVLLQEKGCLQRLLGIAAEHDKDVLGVMGVEGHQAANFGNCGRIEYRELAGGALELKVLHGKQPGSLVVPPGERILRTCGRMVCQPHFYEFIDRLRPQIRGEYSEVPVFQQVLAEKGVLGSVIASPLFDVGNERGFLAANAYLHAQARQATDAERGV